MDAAADPCRACRFRPGAIGFYITAEIEDEYAAGADQLPAKTFDDGEYADGDQDVVTNGYDALPRLLADGLQIQLNTPVTGGNRSFE